MELERLQVVIEASLGDFKRKMTAVKGIVNNATSQVKVETDKIKYSMDNMAGKVKTANIDKLRDKIKSANGDLADMYARMDEMKASKYAEMSEMPYNETQLDTAVGEVLNKDKAYQKLSESIRKAEQELERYNVAISEANALQEISGSKSNKLVDIFDRVKSTLSRAKGQANLFSKNLRGINLAAIPVTRSIFKLSTMFKLMALRMVMRAAINAIKSGFQDLTKYSGNFNGTMSQISSVLLQARNSLATAFAPALQALTPIINSVTNAFINAFNTIGMFTARLFGNAATFTKAKQVSVDYAKSLGGTEKAAKKAGGALAAFDEINVLSQDSGSEDTGVPSASQMFEEIAIPDESISAIDKFKNKLTELIEPLKNISFDNLINAFGRFKEAISPFTKTIFGALEWAYLNIFVPLSKWVITEVLPKFLDILSGMFETFNKVLELFKPVGIWLWENFLKPLAQWTGGAIVDILDGIAYAWSKLADYVGGIQEVIANSDGFLNALVNVGIYLVEGLFSGIISAISGIGTWLWNNVVKPMIDGVKKLFGIASPSTVFAEIGKWLIEGLLQGVKNTWNVITEFFRNVLLKLMVFFQDMWGKIADVAANAWDSVKNAWQIAGEWFNNTVITPVSGFFSGLKDIIVSLLSSAWTGIQSIWKDASKWFEDKISTPIANVFKALKDTMKNVWDGILDVFKLPINTIIGWINKLIDAWNSLEFKVPEINIMGVTFGGFSVGTPKISNIPKLATGAVIPPNSEFLAVLGDQRSGRNIEAPEGLIRQIVREELQGLSGSEDLNITMPVYLDNEKIFEGQKKVQRRRGKSLVKGAFA